MTPNPWALPLALTSANVIWLRTMMLWPVGGRHDGWQRRESVRMVAEKVEAVREAQLAAIAMIGQAMTMPWALVGLFAPGGAQRVRRAHRAAGAAIAAPFSRRAAANARRLQARAMRQGIEAATAVPTVVATALVGAPAKRRTRRRTT